MAPTTTRTSPTQTTQRKPRRRPPRGTLALIGSGDDAANTPAAEEECAAEFVADLAALMEAGLIAPIEQHGAVRYAVIDPDGPVA